ncbi:MAG: diguanylate cyclase [Bacillota bacterium]
MSPRFRPDEVYGLPFNGLRSIIVRVYWLGLAAALTALVWPTPLVRPLWLLPAVAVGGLAAGIVGPWLLDRYRHSRLYLVVLSVGAAALGVLVDQTGAALSPFWNFYLIMIALVSALLPPRRALAGVALIVVGSLLPLVWHNDLEYLRQAGVAMLFYAFMGYLVSSTAIRFTVERRQKDHLRRLADVSRTATGLDVNATLQGATENLVAATDADSGIIFFVQDEKIQPRVIVLSPKIYTEQEFETVRRFSIPRGEGLVGWVAQHGEPLLSGDAGRDPRNLSLPGFSPASESALVVPMKLDGRVIGVVHLSRLGLNQFDAEDLSLVQIMADQTAVAVENARLYEQTQNRAASLLTLAEVTRASQSSLEPQVLLRQVEMAMSRFFQFDRFALGMMDPSGETYRVIYQGGRQPPAGTSADASPVPGSILEWMVRENRPYWVPDVSQNSHFVEDTQLLQAGLRSVVRAPLWADDRVIGLCSMSSTKAGAFTLEDAELFADIARVVGLALEHARTHQELKERAAQVEVMSQIALAANASLNLSAVTNALERELHKVIPFHMMRLALLEDDGRSYRCLADTAGQSHPTQGSALSTMMETHQPVVQTDMRRDQLCPEDEEAVRAGMRSSLRVPLEAGGKLVGALVLLHRAPGAYSDHHLEVAVQVGRQAALAVHNAQLYAEMEKLATTDPLTGLYNRRFFYNAWDDVSRRAQDGSAPLSLLMVDINHFKGYNDRYGHVAGDKLLREAAGILQEQVRASDVVARYGGDEFVVLMPETTELQARRVKERIERAVATRNALRSPEEAPLALDIGVESARGEALEHLLSRADAAMYRAKESADRRQLRAVVAASEQERQRHALQTVLSLAKIEEMKDAYTRGHSERLREMAVEVGRAMGLPEAELQNIAYGAILHDIGKVAVPTEILHKPGELTAEEVRIMRMHPILGEAMIADVDLLQGARPIIRHHQERFDGRTHGERPGYPDGLAGEQIPLGARIIAVVDAFDAMTTDRPYRPGRTREQAMEEIRANAGTQFDPTVVRIFEQVAGRWLNRPAKGGRESTAEGQG